MIFELMKLPDGVSGNLISSIRTQILNQIKLAWNPIATISVTLGKLAISKLTELKQNSSPIPKLVFLCFPHVNGGGGGYCHPPSNQAKNLSYPWCFYPSSHIWSWVSPICLPFLPSLSTPKPPSDGLNHCKNFLTSSHTIHSTRGISVLFKI